MSTPAKLADVRDFDLVQSLSPLRLGLGFGYVTGWRAIIQRVLYRWCTLRGTARHAPDLGLTTPLLDIEGRTFSPADLRGLRAQLEKQAKAEDFVVGASVPIRLSDSGLLIVQASIKLTDSKVYPLEVGPAEASAGAYTLFIGGSS